MKFRVLVNPAAGGGKAARLFPKVKSWLDNLPHQTDFKITGSRDDLTDSASEAVEQDYDAIIVVGGDGTFHDVITCCREDGPALGAIPGGRGNDFILNMNYPAGLQTICEGFANPKFITVDLPTVNGVPFISIGGVGFDSEIARKTRDGRCKVSGTFCYVWYLLKTLFTYKSLEMEIEIDGQRSTELVTMAAAANTPYYGGGMKLVPDAIRDDGLLDVIIIKDMSKLNLIRKFPKIYSGTHVPDKDIILHRAKRITFKANREADIFAEGEYVTSLPATFEIGTKRLRVMVPGH